MKDIFNAGLVQNIIGGVIVLFISILFARKTLASTTSAKGWKAMVVIGNIMIFGGILFAISHYSDSGLNNPYVNYGALTSIFGFPIKYLGRFFVWWHR
jgi:hypothetical protein